jgi:CRP-like cAMP-binding protein
LVDEAISREWIVNVGQRTGYERTAHLLCEVFFRMNAVGLAPDNSCDFPMTQHELADTVALSPVHVNRILQELRQDGLIVLRDKRLTILDLGKLKIAGIFNPNYLQLDILETHAGSFAI